MWLLCVNETIASAVYRTAQKTRNLMAEFPAFSAGQPSLGLGRLKGRGWGEGVGGIGRARVR